MIKTEYVKALRTANLPSYFKIQWDDKPSKLDNVGSDGLYISGIRIIKWWGYPCVLCKGIYYCIANYIKEKTTLGE